MCALGAAKAVLRIKPYTCELRLEAAHRIADECHLGSVAVCRASAVENDGRPTQKGDMSTRADSSCHASAALQAHYLRRDRRQI